MPYFKRYPENDAPFMHLQLSDWMQKKPLQGLRVIHHVPLVANTMLKIACLLASGADVTVTNPDFMMPDKNAILTLQKSGIRYVNNLSDLKNETFDLYFDCGATLYQHLPAPTVGAIELTGSGDQYYRTQQLTFPVVSIDRTLTKQLETIFGCGESISDAILKLTGANATEQKFLIFGFGKIGRGLSYFCIQNKVPVVVVDPEYSARKAASSLNIPAISSDNQNELEKALVQCTCVVTATGKKSILNAYPKNWFDNKILLNMGVYDEYGEQFSNAEVLNNKLPANFILEDPTPIKYMDAELYIHNIAALQLIQNSLPNAVSDFQKQDDQNIIEQWCRFHRVSKDDIRRWFIAY